MKPTANSLSALPIHPIQNAAENNHSCIALYKLVNQVIMSLSLKAIHQTSFMTNNVQEELLVSTDKNILNAIVTSLLRTVLLHDQGNNIQVSAKLIGNITLMHIKTNDTGQMQAFTQSIEKIQPMARSIGGCITITNGKFHGINLAFTFINH
jgi:hypothetical protein